MSETAESQAPDAANGERAERLLSLIVPVYFEQECIEQFINETTAVLTTLPDRREMSSSTTAARIGPTTVPFSLV